MRRGEPWQKKRGFWNGMHLLLTLRGGGQGPTLHGRTLPLAILNFCFATDRAVAYVALLTYLIDCNSFQASAQSLFAQHEIAMYTFDGGFCLMRCGSGRFQVQ